MQPFAAVSKPRVSGKGGKLFGRAILGSETLRRKLQFFRYAQPSKRMKVCPFFIVKLHAFFNVTEKMAAQINRNNFHVSSQ